MFPQNLLVQLLDAILGWHCRDPSVREAMAQFLRERTFESGFALANTLDAGPQSMHSEGAALGTILRATQREIARIGGTGDDVLEGAGEWEHTRWVALLAGMEGRDD